MNPLWVLGLVVTGAAALSRLLGSSDSSQAKTNEAKKPVLIPRAFISFDFDNNEKQKRMFAGQCRANSPTPFAAQDWSSKEALPQGDWERLIEEKIGRCHLMFVLVSPTSHRASGVTKEIAMAIARGVPFVGVYIAGADASTPLPKGLARDRTHPWKWKPIAAAVDRMLKGRGDV